MRAWRKAGDLEFEFGSRLRNHEIAATVGDLGQRSAVTRPEHADLEIGAPHAAAVLFARHLETQYEYAVETGVHALSLIVDQALAYPGDKCMYASQRPCCAALRRTAPCFAGKAHPSESILANIALLRHPPAHREHL